MQDKNEAIKALALSEVSYLIQDSTLTFTCTHVDVARLHWHATVEVQPLGLRCTMGGYSNGSDDVRTWEVANRRWFILNRGDAWQCVAFATDVDARLAQKLIG